MAKDYAVFDEAPVKRFIESIERGYAGVKERSDAFAALVGAVVYRDVIDHFAAEEGSDGAWTDWAPSYSALMNRLGRGGNKILQNTGRLRQSFAPSNWRRSTDGMEWFNPAKTAGGFPYAFAHNEGGSKLPQRDFMWLSTNALEDIASQALKFVQDGG